MLNYSQDVFTRIPVTAERFASSASLQYYEYSTNGRLPVAIVKNFQDYLLEKVCPKESDRFCKDDVRALDAAEHFDIDYDTISQSLSMSAFFQQGSALKTWNERIEQSNRLAKVEIGILADEKATRAQELSLGGYLVTLGEDTKASTSFMTSFHCDAQN